MFWQHLANAGLIEGSYTGIAGSAGIAHHIAGENTPRSKFSNGCWGVTWWGPISSSPSAYDGNYTHILALGKQSASTFCGVDAGSEILVAEEAWNIDTKLDDGRPGTGTVISYKDSFKGNCTTGDNGSTAEYDLTNSNVGCTLILRASY